MLFRSGAVGLEREMRRQTAGLRTHILIAIGAALLSLLSIWMPQAFGLDKSDPTRIAAQIVSGIGFLGAGLIFNGKASGVQGVTTAATVFATAAVGSAVGLGFQLSAVGITVLLLAILRSTHMLEAAAIKLHLTENEQND